MRQKTKIIFIIITLSMVMKATAASAVTYFVSNSGNDSNPGTSESNPWQTIEKVNSSIFQPGDNILFKRGDVWREQLTVPSSGAEGSSITFGAYGSGENPKILRTDTYTAWYEHSLIHNGGMEGYAEKNPNDDIFDWGEQKGPGANSYVQTDIGVAHMGTSAKLHAEGTGAAFGSGDYASLAYWINLKSDTEYHFSVWGRTDSAGDNNLLFQIKNTASNQCFYESSGWQSDCTKTALSWNGERANEWIQKKIVFKTPTSETGTISLRLAFYDFQNGNAWVDDAYLVEGTAPSPTKIWAGSIRGNSNYWGAVSILDGKRIRQYENYPEKDPFFMEEGYFNAPLNGNFFFFRNDTGNPGPMEVGARKMAILIRQKYHIVVDGIDVSGPGGNISPYDVCKSEEDENVTGNCLLIRIDSYSDNIIVRNLEVNNAHSTGIWSAATSTNVTYENLNVYDNRSTGIYNNSRGGGVINCKSHDNGRLASDGDSADRGGIGSFQGGDLLIKGNEVYRNGQDDQGADMEVSIVGAVNPIFVRNNYIHDCIQGCVQIAEGGDNSEIIHNVINGFGTTTIDQNQGSAGKFAGIRIGGGTKGARNVKVNNNIITGGASSKNTTHAGISVPNLDCSGLTVINNIFFNNISKDIYIGVYSYAVEGYDFSNNLYSKSDYSNNWFWQGVNYSSLASWQQDYQLDLNSQIGDPLFKNLSGNYTQPSDFKLSSSSPAIDAGADVGLTADFEGTPVPQGPAPDIGAFEYKSGGSTYNPADINEDSFVNVTDLGILMSDYGKTSNFSNPRSDINSDGSVNVIDLGIMMSEWK